MKRPFVVGLDLSTRAAAAVAVPLDWDGVWSRVSAVVVGEPLRRNATDAERARRTETIAASLLAFAQDAAVVFIEGYAYSLNTSSHTLGELGGVVRLELVRAGVLIRTANIGVARKLLLGKVPRRNAKEEVERTLRAAGAMFATADEYDAFACANLGLCELGAYCFAQPERGRAA